MDSVLPDVPWFVTYAAEPFELLKIIHPHLVNATLPPPARPIRLSLERRSTCDTGSSNSNSNNNNNNSNNSNNSSSNTKSSNTGVLVGAVVGAVVGTLAIAILCFILYKRKQRKQLEEKKTEGVNAAGTPFKDEAAMATPFTLPGMTHNQPPNTGGYAPGMTGMNPEMHQFQNTMAAGYTQPTNPHFSYVPPPSVTSTTSPSGYTGTGSETNYYNYAPPLPAQSPQPTISSGTASTGISYYGSTPAPPFMNPHSTPSPPPPSGTPSSVGMQWAPWAIPSTGTGNEPGMFPTAGEEKAHYSGREWTDEKAQYRSNTMSGRVGEGGRVAGGGGSSSSANLVKEGENSGPVDPRDGARSPGVGITSDSGPRPGAMSPSPPAYTAQ